MIWFRAGSFLMAFSIVLGAFGAHALKGRLDPALLEVYRTGVLYQMFNAVGLIAVGLRASAGYNLRAAGVAFAVGTVLFSGSLYVVSLAGLKWAGAITPLGGVAMITAWILLAIA